MYYMCVRGKQAVAGPSTRAILVILVSLLNRQLAWVVSFCWKGGKEVDGKVYSHLTHRLVGVAGTEGAPPTAEMTCEGTGRTEATAEVAEATGAGSEVAEATALLTAEVAEATAPVAVDPAAEDMIIEDIMEEVVDSSVEL
jgi:hypothetical protein